MKMFRQGDVLLVQVDGLPEGAVKEDAQERIVLAYGESTGHAHAISARHASLYRFQDDRLIETTEGAVLTHEEHAPIPLPKGVFRVIRQREYTPSAVRFVAD